jgi:hypothetical protein
LFARVIDIRPDIVILCEVGFGIFRLWRFIFAFAENQK